jgi:hypothetical protein
VAVAVQVDDTKRALAEASLELEVSLIDDI